MAEQTSIGIIGAGSWGTALAVLANRAGSKVRLWTRNETIAESIAEKRVNEAYLADIFIDPKVEVTTDIADVKTSDLILIVVPAQSLRTICIALSDILEVDIPIIVACKGIERGSLSLMSEVVASILPANPIAILSGPNFADEAAKGLPTATTLACEDAALAEYITYAIGGRMFRPYHTKDLISTQIGGSLKNVIALACGIAEGKGLGENAKAALITRGLAEMTRLAQIKGGKATTLMGLSGIGDLMLTCSSRKSRNMSLGYSLGQGKGLQEALPAHVHGLTEGVTTADSAYELSMKLGVAMPISIMVHYIIRGKVSVDDGIAELLGRPLGAVEG